MKLRAETKLVLWLIAAGIALGVVRVMLRSRGLATEQGPGGLAMFLGVAASSTALWCVLAMRTLAAGGPVAHAIDDGLCSVAVSVWLFALLPMRPSSYWSNGATDDFALAYLPAALIGVPLLLGARQVWAERTGKQLALRFAAVLAVVVALTGALVRFLVRGPGAADVSVRAWIISLVLVAVSAVLLRLSARR